MKLHSTLLIPASAVVASLTLWPAALAQDAASGEPAEQPSQVFLPEQQPDELRADELLGTSVENAEGESLGTIKDVVIAEGEGIKAVVVGIGGFLGVGEKEVAVSYDRLEHERAEDGRLQLVLQADRAALEEAPEFVTFEAKREAEMQAQRDAEMEMQRQQMGQPSPTGLGTGGAGGSGLQ